jgi:hypothetical protein
LTYKQRVDTLRILVDAHHIVRTSPKLSQIVGEMYRITASTKVPKNNGWLLSVLHTTRTLDTTLGEIVKYKGWIIQSPSLGRYLAALCNNGILSPPERNGYNDKIVQKRNMYMHEAGAMPNKLEADSILGEMHACLSIVLARL